MYIYYILYLLGYSVYVSTFFVFRFRSLLIRLLEDYVLYTKLLYNKK